MPTSPWYYTRTTERNPGASPSKIDGGTMEEPPSDILTLSDLRQICRKLKVKKTVISSGQLAAWKTRP